jgi:acetyl-CoA synthetase
MPALPPVTGPSLIAIEGAEVPPSLFEYVHRTLAPNATQVVQVVARPEVGGFAAGPDPCVCTALPASVGPPAPGVPLVIVDQQSRVCSSTYGGFAALLHPIPSLALDLQSQELPIRLGIRARVDREGFFWPMGEAGPERSDDETVSMQEIEAMVAGLPEVDQVAVVHYSTPARVPRIAMFVKPEKGVDDFEKRIIEAVYERFGDDAVPHLVQFVDELPVSRTGKLLRSVLRQIAEGDTDALADDEIAANSEMIHRILGKGRT